MSIEVETPDGGIAEFPDGTAPDVIRSAMRAKFGGGPAKNVAREMSLSGIAKAAGRGLEDFAVGLAGLPGDVRELVGAGVKAGGRALGLPEPPAETEAPNIIPTSAGVQRGIEKVTGPSYEPQNTAEKYIRSVASFAPGIVAGPGGLARRAVTQVALPGVASEASGDIPGIKGTSAEPIARGVAALLSPIAAERLVTPLTTPQTRAAAAAALKREGVEVTAGQKTGSKFLRKQEEELGGSTTEALAQRQAEQFTAAALRRVGEVAPRATPDVIDSAFNRIGNNMNRLAASNTLIADQRMLNEVARAESEYNRLVAPSQRAPVVDNAVSDILAQSPNGVMTGDQYQTLRSQLGADGRRLRNDTKAQEAVYSIQKALDDAMERSIGRQNPMMLGEWKTARRQYRDLLSIEKAVLYQGEAAAGGIITPPNLARAVKSTQGGRNYSRGRGDLQNLARAGAEVMTPLANSNTASRLRTHMFLTGLGAAVGAGGGIAGGPHAAIAGAITGAALPRGIGEGLIRGRRYLGNELIRERQTLGSNVLRTLIGLR